MIKLTKIFIALFISTCQLTAAHSTEENRSGPVITRTTTYNDATYTSKIFSKSNNQNVELTILSLEDAQNLFNDIKKLDNIPFDYIAEGSFARAHKVSRYLEDNEIISGKAFVEGELYLEPANKKLQYHLSIQENAKNYEKAGFVGLAYHVASLILVKKNNELITYIIDPSIFSKPVTYITCS